MTVELKLHYVAFLDILGFKEMVRHDTLGEEHQYLSLLFKCHQSAAQIFSDDPECLVTQFSDSIVVSKPYEPSTFQWFATRVAEYQRLLLDEQLLCRGGVAIGKHFSNGSFTFSAGLITAYSVESQAARYPRVVISPDVMELLFPDRKFLPNFLILEDDGLAFIDYIGLTVRKKPKKLESSISDVVAKLLNNTTPSVREKGLWLAAYSDAILGTTLSRPKFIGSKVRVD